jgi:prepilin-type N-terminal cleavage/methylation domain-containing protein/prepilin-type processing-associated H-X9-DG protein
MISPLISCSLARRFMFKRRLGFTMVELMVTLGIIVVLVALLLPALNKAREQGRAVTCLSNLRQISHAFIMYTGDSHDNFPQPAWQGDHSLSDWIYWQLPLDASQGTAMPRGVVMRYLGGSNPGVLRCPSDEIVSHMTTNGMAGDATDVYRYSYTVNESICHYAKIIPAHTNGPVLMVSIAHPAQKILLIDENSETINDGCWWATGFLNGTPNVLSNRHYFHDEDHANQINLPLPGPPPYYVGRGNAAFCDGHAEAVERNESMSAAFYDPTVN